MRLEELEKFLEEDLSWRKREISGLILIAQTNSDLVILKSIILLLYAHWEGYIKKSSKVYLKYISDLNRPLSDLTNNFKAVSLKSLIQKCYEGSNGLTLENEIDVLEKLLNSNKVRFKITSASKSFDTDNDFDNSIINTHSNLSPKIFKNILSIIGLNYKSQYLSKENYINSHLLANRNLIGHGSKFVEKSDQDFTLKLKDIEKLRDIVFCIIDTVKDEITEYARKEFFLDQKKDELYTFLKAKESEVEGLFKAIETKYD